MRTNVLAFSLKEEAMIDFNFFLLKLESVSWHSEPWKSMDALLLLSQLVSITIILRNLEAKLFWNSANLMSLHKRWWISTKQIKKKHFLKC